jgi:hypothetical protein
LDFVDKYARAAVKRDERERGPWRGCEWQDVVQQSHLELCQALGPHYPQHIANAQSCGYELRALARAIWRAISKARYHKLVVLDLRQENPWVPAVSETELVDRTVDLSQLLARFTLLEGRIWEGLRAGKSTRAIGREVGLDFRRVASIRRDLLSRLTHCLAS